MKETFRTIRLLQEQCSVKRTLYACIFTGGLRKQVGMKPIEGSQLFSRNSAGNMELGRSMIWYNPISKAYAGSWEKLMKIKRDEVFTVHHDWNMANLFRGYCQQISGKYLTTLSSIVLVDYHKHTELINGFAEFVRSILKIRLTLFGFFPSTVETYVQRKKLLLLRKRALSCILDHFDRRKAAEQTRNSFFKR